MECFYAEVFGASEIEPIGDVGSLGKTVQGPIDCCTEPEVGSENYPKR